MKMPFGVKFELAKNLTNRLMDLAITDIPKIIKDKAFYTVNLAHIKYDVHHAIGRFFDVPKEIDYDYENGTLSVKLDNYTTNNKKSVYIYQGTPIIFYSELANDRKKNDDAAMAVFYLSTINSEKHIKNMKKFILKMIHIDEKICSNFYKDKMQLMNGSQDSGPIYKLRGRTFNDVFIRKDIKDLITNSLDKFVNSRDWYKEHNIPYHFGIMLYGSPGSGKSSLAQAIAHYLRAYLVVIPGDSIFRVPRMFADGVIATNPKYINIVLIEDVDCGFTLDDYQRQIGLDGSFTEDTNKRKNGMAQLLNTLDGLGAPSNTIFIFTTNHIEKLDPALIRPGRIDLKIDLGGVCNETFDQFAMKHYGRTIEGVEIPEGLSFATLQTCVMQGMTLEEIKISLSAYTQWNTEEN